MVLRFLLLGNYALRPDAGIVSVKEGIEAAAGSGVNIQWAPGCFSIECPSQIGFGDAIKLATTADVVVVSLGLDQNMESEGHDRETIDLPENQYQLVGQLRKASPNATLVGLLIHGGTVAMKNLLTDLDAIVDAWYDHR